MSCTITAAIYAGESFVDRTLLSSLISFSHDPDALNSVVGGMILAWYYFTLLGSIMHPLVQRLGMGKDEEQHYFRVVMFVFASVLTAMATYFWWGPVRALYAAIVQEICARIGGCSAASGSIFVRWFLVDPSPTAAETTLVILHAVLGSMLGIFFMYASGRVFWNGSRPPRELFLIFVIILLARAPSELYLVFKSCQPQFSYAWFGPVNTLPIGFLFYVGAMIAFFVWQQRRSLAIYPQTEGLEADAGIRTLHRLYVVTLSWLGVIHVVPWASSYYAQMWIALALLALLLWVWHRRRAVPGDSHLDDYAVKVPTVGEVQKQEAEMGEEA